MGSVLVQCIGTTYCIYWDIVSVLDAYSFEIVSVFDAYSFEIVSVLDLYSFEIVLVLDLYSFEIIYIHGNDIAFHPSPYNIHIGRVLSPQSIYLEHFYSFNNWGTDCSSLRVKLYAVSRR